MNEKDYFKYLSNKDRIRYKYEKEKGQILNLVIQYESFINGNWIPIVRYDNTHGFFHRDEMSPHKEQIKTKIYIDNLNEAFQYADSDIKENWKYYKKQYLKNL